MTPPPTRRAPSRAPPLGSLPTGLGGVSPSPCPGVGGLLTRNSSRDLGRQRADREEALSRPPRSAGARPLIPSLWSAGSGAGTASPPTIKNCVTGGSGAGGIPRASAGSCSRTGRQPPSLAAQGLLRGT